MARKKSGLNGHGHKSNAQVIAEFNEFRDQYVIEETLTLDDESDTIIARVNPMVAQRANKTFRIIGAKRGLKFSASIGASDSEVIDLLDSMTSDQEDLSRLLWMARAGKLRGRDNKRLGVYLNRAIDRIKAKYADHENSLRFLVYVYALIADDVFTPKSSGGKIGFESRTEYPISEDYWEHGGGNIRDMDEEEIVDPFDELLMNDAELQQFTPTVDRSSPVELALGETYEIIRHNPRMTRNLMDLVMHLGAYIQLADYDTESLDEESFRVLRTRLSGTIYQRDGGAGENDERDEPALQLQPAAGEDREE